MGTNHRHLELIAEGSQALENLRRDRQALRPDLYAELDRAEARYGAIDARSSIELDRQVEVDRPLLDRGLQRYGSYKATIAELATTMTESLAEYVAFASESQSYQGLEKPLAWFMATRRTANRMRIDRLKAQSPRDNLQVILDYAERLFNEIREVRESAIETYSRLQSSVDIITTKISEFEPREAELKEKLDAMEAELEERREAFRSAASSNQARLVGLLNELEKELVAVRSEHEQVVTIYSQAQQALAANQQSRDAFEKMVRDLGRQATMIKEKIDNVSEVYMAAPEAVKVMMTTRGMEAVDASVNAATSRSVDMITRSAEAVSDATLRREAVELIDEATMRGYHDRMASVMRDFNERFDAVRARAQRSHHERYDAARDGERRDA